MAEEVCSFWVGYLLSSPIRKLWHNPEKILRPYINQSMRVLDIGCAMGFFSLAMAKMVGRDGRVICVDVQEKMISSLLKRAKSTGVYDRIETRTCTRKSLCIENLREQIDFALAFAVVHEAPDPSSLFSEIYEALKPAGKLLIAEPKGRVSEKDFEASVRTAQGNGFEVVERLHIRSARAVLLQK
jgi:ubiquinone/menaquinone biosynthesis C-methylase UbiE